MLKNQGLNVIWFQNEGMFPTKTVLTGIIKRFKNIVVFFDNDIAGLEASVKLVKMINNMYMNKARSIHLPTFLKKVDITDPSDLYSKKGVTELKGFLKSKNLY